MAVDLYEDPFRLRIAKALTATLEGITTEGGYKHDLAGKVFRGRNLFGDAGGEDEGGDPIPMLSILEVPIQPDQALAPEESDKSTGLWDLTIQGFCEDDKKNPTDPAYRLAADTVKALILAKRAPSLTRKATGKAVAIFGITTRTGNAAVIDILVGSPVCRPPDELSGKAYFWLPISLKLAENLEDPYG